MIRVRWFLLKLAILNTFKKKFRAALAIGGIALSCSVMIVLFGVGMGLQGMVTDQVTNSDAKDVLTVNQRNIQEIKLDDQLVSEVTSISGVGQVDRLVGLVGTLTYHGIDLNIPVYAVSEGYFGLSSQDATFGSLEKQPVDNDIIMSTKALETFNISRGAEGKTITASLDISPEYSKGDTEDTTTTKPDQFTITAGVDRGDLPVAYIPLEYARSQGVVSVSQLKLRLSNPDKLTAVRESIEQMGLQTTSVQDSIEQVNRIFGVIQRILLIFGIIAFVITVFGTFNVITLTLIEETQQVGFLRVMGMQKHEVAFLFIAQSVLLTGVGALTGIVAGTLTGFVINGLTQTLIADTVAGSSVVLFKLPALQIIIMLVLSMVLGWLIGKIPSKRAVLIEPLEELRG